MQSLCHVSSLSELNVSNADARDVIAVPLCPSILLAALLLEDSNLRAPADRVNHAQNLGARHERRTCRDRARVLTDEKHPIEDQPVGGVVVVPVDFDERTGLDTKLTAGSLNNRKHLGSPRKTELLSIADRRPLRPGGPLASRLVDGPRFARYANQGVFLPPEWRRDAQNIGRPAGRIGSHGFETGRPWHAYKRSAGLRPLPFGVLFGTAHLGRHYQCSSVSSGENDDHAEP